MIEDDTLFRNRLNSAISTKKWNYMSIGRNFDAFVRFQFLG